MSEDEVEDAAAMEAELKEAFRLYDKEGNFKHKLLNSANLFTAMNAPVELICQPQKLIIS